MNSPASLLVELAVVRAERNRLRDMATRRAEERKRLSVRRLVERAKLDAIGLITVHYAGGLVARWYAPISARRWQYAVALLRLAGLVRRGRDVRLIMPTHPNDALDALDRAVAAACATPGRLGALIPRSTRPRLLYP